MNCEEQYNEIKNLLNSNLTFTSCEVKEIQESAISLCNDYLKNNILSISNSNFDKEITDYIYNNINETITTALSKQNKYKFKNKLKKIIKKVKNITYTKFIPVRSYKETFIRNVKQNIKNLEKKVQYIRDIPQPQQRTLEWYQFRHNLLTASSIWKVLNTQANINNLIYEKCKPFQLFASPPLESPLHWGQKYEPVSIELYECIYNTKIEDFGCIKHPQYPFIGASPDGINVDKDNPRFARMLEIKNVVSREITGIPKPEYWIQMQVQMETCDLNECDFLETKFVEYENYEDFINDGTFTYNEDNKLKGIMLLFNNNGNTFYEYAPLYISLEHYLDWENKMFEKNKESEWIRTIYWKLEKFSNILVLRNKLWFNAALPKFKEIWETIEKERLSGYEHRAPKKRSFTENMPNKCLINIEKLS